MLAHVDVAILQSHEAVAEGRIGLAGIFLHCIHISCQRHDNLLVGVPAAHALGRVCASHFCMAEVMDGLALELVSTPVNALLTTEERPHREFLARTLLCHQYLVMCPC